MVRRLGAVYAMALFCAAAAPLAAQNGDAASQSAAAAKSNFNTAQFASYVDKAFKSSSTPGMAIAIVSGDQILWTQTFGVANLATRQPVTPDTLFNTGSVTKSLTAAVVMSLAEEGLLDLDRPVSEYHPGLMPEALEGVVTLRDLLAHRSGLAPAAYSLMGEIGRAEAVRRIRLLPIAAPVRTKMIYNNFGYLAAAAVAERVSGKSWEALVRERALAPAGMRAKLEQSERGGAAVAQAHGARDERVIAFAPVSLAAVAPAGAIELDITNLARWVQVQLNSGAVGERQIFTARGAHEMRSPQIWQPVTPGFQKIWPTTHFRGYGLGWFLRDYQGVKLVEHGGNTAGFTAQIAMVPERDFGVAILSNLDGDSLPVALMYQAIDSALGIQGSDWVAAFKQLSSAAPTPAPAAAQAAAAPAPPLAALAGTYSHPFYNAVRITSGRPTLSIAISERLQGSLAPAGGPAFKVTWSDPYFSMIGDGFRWQFEDFVNGVPQTLRYDLPGDPILFKRSG